MYIKIEKDIDGDKITAEYFESNFNYSSKPQKISDILWGTITTPFYIARRKIKDIYWEVRYGFQRMFKGYDSIDVIETYQQFIDRYTKILTQFKESKMSHPGTLTKEEWDNIIDQMLYHLYYMDENNVDKELSKDVSDNLIPTLRISYEIMEKHKDEFFKLFSEWFYHLWS